MGSPFNAPNKVYVNDVLHEFPYASTVLPLNYGKASAGLRYQANEVRNCIKAGKLESDRMPHKDSILIANIEDEIRKQVGVKYDVDSI